MPFREKFAWLALAAMLVTVGPYFTLAAMDQLPDSTGQRLAAYGAAAIAQMAILAAGYLYMFWQTPDEVKAPADEREVFIMHRARTIAYYVMMAGFILSGCIMPFGATGWRIVNASLFMIVVSEAVYYGGVVLQYRRQSA